MATASINLSIYRNLCKMDVPQVMAIEQAVYTHPWTRGIFYDCLNGNYTCRVLEQGGRVLAYSIISAAVGEAHLLNICVDPKQQSQGIGRYLMFKIFADAKSQNAENMILEVRPSNLHAIQLYQSLGFVEVGRRKDYYPAASGREDALVYILDLTGINLT